MSVCHVGRHPNTLFGVTYIVLAPEHPLIAEVTTPEQKAEVDAYRKGKDKLFGFFVGQVMKATQGKANPQLVNELLKKKLLS